MKKERLINIDLFKIICAISVIIIHVSSYHMFDIRYINMFYECFSVINFYNIITRFCVPGFIMVSGMFMLNKNLTFKELLKKYIFKIVVLYTIFSLLYSIEYYYERNVNIISTFFSGYYHLWYLHLLIGLYLITPVLSKMVKNERLTVCFLIFCFLFTSINLMLIEWIKLNIFKTNELNTRIELDVCMALGYIGYYVAGYYLSKNKTNNVIFYILGLIGSISNIIIFNKISYYNDFYNCIYLMPGTVLQSIAIFLFFKNLKVKNTLYNIIRFVSGYTLGIYLVHLFIIKIIFFYFPSIIYQYSIISIPIVSITVFLVSLLISIILKKLPILKNFL